MSPRRLAALAALALAGVVAGCPGRRVPPPPDALTDPAAVLATATARTRDLRSLAVEARVSSYVDGQARKGRMVLLARRPASLHFSALSPTDDLLGVLASDGERFSSFERGGTTCQVGRSCPRNVGRYLPIALPGADVVELLMGGAPFIRHTRQAVSWDARAGAYRVELEGDGGYVQRVWVGAGSGQVKRTTLDREGRRVLELVFRDFEEVGGHVLPHTLEVRMPRQDVDVRLRYRDVEVNGDLADDAFRIPCPAGTVEEELPCEDPPGDR